MCICNDMLFIRRIYCRKKKKDMSEFCEMFAPSVFYHGFTCFYLLSIKQYKRLINKD